jgi:hypothetical protein
MAACANRGLIDSAMASGVTSAGNSFTEPSGSCTETGDEAELEEAIMSNTS